MALEHQFINVIVLRTFSQLESLLCPASMPASSEEEYELLPSYDDHDSEPGNVRRCVIPHPVGMGEADVDN